MTQDASTPYRGKLSPLLKQSSGLLVTRGEGPYVFDDAGRRDLDFTTGIAVTNTGHCHPKVVEAVRRQAGELIHGQYTTVRHPRVLELSEQLAERTPEAIDSFFFANAGSESVESALRLARHATGRTNVIVFQGSFHGRTVGAASMTTSTTGPKAGLQPLMAGVFVAPFPHVYHYGWDEETTTRFCLRELDHLLATTTSPKETAALFVEPVQGDGGYVPANTAFLQGLRERCDQHGMLLVADEIQAGFGRTGRFWSHQHFDVQPDLLIMGKGLASGFPLSSMGAPADLMAKGWPGSQGGTYGGNAVACAAALATLEVIDEDGLVNNADRMGQHLRSRLEALQSDDPSIGDVRGMGLMYGTEIVDSNGRPDGARVTQLLAETEKRGVLMMRCGAYGGQIVRWLPALGITEEQIDHAIDVFREALEATA